MPPPAAVTSSVAWPAGGSVRFIPRVDLWPVPTKTEPLGLLE